MPFDGGFYCYIQYIKTFHKICEVLLNCCGLYPGKMNWKCISVVAKCSIMWNVRINGLLPGMRTQTFDVVVNKALDMNWHWFFQYMYLWWQCMLQSFKENKWPCNNNKLYISMAIMENCYSFSVNCWHWLMGNNTVLTWLTGNIYAKIQKHPAKHHLISMAGQTHWYC